MTQRMALILAAVLTAFLLVVSGGVIARVSQGDVKTAAAAPAAVIPVPTGAPVSEMAAQMQALIQERETAYRDLIKRANEQLQAAYQQPNTTAAARPAVAQSRPAVAAPAPTYAISADAAASIASSVVSGMALVRSPELVLFEGHVAYEVVFKHASVYIDANSGQVLFNGTQHGGNGRGRSTASAPSSGSGEHEHEGEGEHND